MIRCGLIVVAACWLLMPVAGPAADAPRIERVTKDGFFKQRPVWSPDGKTLCYARHEGNQISLWLQTESQEPVRLTDRKLPEYDASWSPDGKQLVVCLVAQSPGQGDLDLGIVTVESKEITPLLANAGQLSHEEAPAWSPDGERIVCTSTREGNQEIYLLSKSGENLERLTQDPAIDAHPEWSPDGQSIVFATNRWGDFELARLDVASRNVERLTRSAGLDDYPVYSPDGQWIAFTSHRSGDFEIFVMPATGGEAVNISQHPGVDNFPGFTPQGDLTWLSNRSESRFDVYRCDAAVWKSVMR